MLNLMLFGYFFNSEGKRKDLTTVKKKMERMIRSYKTPPDGGGFFTKS